VYSLSLIREHREICDLWVTRNGHIVVQLASFMMTKNCTNAENLASRGLDSVPPIAGEITNS
jgi:hypothetical protein